MSRKLVLFFSSLVIFPALGMENNQLQQWVKNAKKVEVRTIKTIGSYDIDDYTNIEGVKEKLFDLEGVSVEQQELKAYWRGFYGWGYSNYSDPLPNDGNVKTIMNKYNTAVFALSISLREKSEK